MDHQKLDARLNEALEGADSHARFEVFVEISGDADDKDIARLSRLGVRRRGTQTTVTATLTRTHVGEVSEIRAVRHVHLSRRLRHS